MQDLYSTSPLVEYRMKCAVFVGMILPDAVFLTSRYPQNRNLIRYAAFLMIVITLSHQASRCIFSLFWFFMIPD